MDEKINRVLMLNMLLMYLQENMYKSTPVKGEIQLLDKALKEYFMSIIDNNEFVFEEELM